MIPTMLAFLVMGTSPWAAAQIPTAAFQQGVSGYSGTQDTYILRTSPNTATDAQRVVQVRDTMQGLVRFDDLFGMDPAQIPLGVTIVSARLALTTAKSSADSIALHRLLVPWLGATATWNFFDDGISVEADEAHATADSVFVPNVAVGAVVQLDVTASVQAWANGTANDGWVFFSAGTDVYRFHSSEAASLELRPRLEVEWMAGPEMVIVTQPANQVVHLGESVTFTATVLGDEPHFFQWFFGASLLQGATNRTLHLPNVTAEDAGSYTLRATNAVSTVFSEEAVLTVLPPEPLDIVTQPVSQIVREGDPATFVAEFSGSGPHYQWYFGNEPISGATNSTLNIPAVFAEHVGTYKLVASNLVNTVTTDEVTLGLLPPDPVVIMAPPAHASVHEGANATFSVVATGSGVGYQWNRNGTPIPNATNASLTLSGVKSEAVGWYQVVASNHVNSQSASAFLLMLPQPFVNHQIFALSNIWRYNASGLDLGTEWKEPDYDDSSWLTGQGVFGFGDPPVINPITIVTHYFRTRFTVTNSPWNYSLISSNLIDDGAVVYLNGQEAFRYNMPEGPVDASTHALMPLSEWVFLRMEIPRTNMVAGENVLAVSVHQANPKGGDMVFGMSLHAEFPPASLLAITRQPDSIVAEEGFPVTLSAEVAGTGAFYQWFKDSVAIPGANAASYALPSAVIADSGTYQLVAGNISSTVVSEPVTLTVVADTTPPRVAFSYRTAPDQVLVEFSEPVDAAAAALPGNYSIVLAGASIEIAVISVQILAPDKVLLTTSPLDPGANYLISGRNIRDASLANVIVPELQSPVGFEARLFPFETRWVFWSFGTFPGENWMQPDYDDSGWPGAPGDLPAYAPFAHSVQDIRNAPVHTALSVGPARPAFYFRKVFDFPGSLIGSKIFLSQIVDEGAVFYLNGVEVHRIGMPPGPVSHETRAGVTNNFPAFARGPFELPPHLLRPSGNVLAARLHQSAPLSRNAAFAAALDGVIGSLTSGPIIDLSIEETVTVREGDLTALTRSASGAGTFQWHRNGEPIGGATQPAHTFRVSAADEGARFTLRFANGETNLISRGITLNVVPDVEPPQLASAMLSLPGSVVVEFSEPVSAQAALDPANYILSTDSGAQWPVTAVSSLNSTSVLLTLSGSMPGAGPWILGARNITDLAVNANTIDPARRMSVGFEGELVGWTSFWRHLRELINPMPAYREVDFDDSAWSLEQAVFDVSRFSPRTTVAGLPVNSFLTWEGASANEGRRTYFFRTKLELPVDPAATLFEAQSLVDDGVVIFVNGQEAFRLGVPPGESVNTFANRTVGTAGMEGPFVLPTHVFVPGDNFIVAQIHQVTMTSSDATFALRLTATARSFPVTIFPPTAGWEPMNTPAGALSSNSGSSK